MGNELLPGETFSDVSPGKTVTSTRLNGHVSAAKLLVSAISNKTELAANGTAAGDMALVQDVSDGVASEPKKVQLQNFLPELVRQQTQLYAAGTLSGGVYAVTLSPAATAYTTGMVVVFKADTANTGAVDINVNAIGAKNLFTRSGGELAANDILANQIVITVYNGTEFQVLQVLSAGEVTATHCAEANRQSVHQYAAGVQTATVYAVTLSPAATAYTAGMVVRFKADSANAGAVDINVNGQGAKNIFKNNGSSELVANDILANQVVTLVYDGTQFQMLDVRSPGFTSAEQAVTLSGVTVAVAHGLGAVPSRIRWVLVCKTAELGFSIGDEVDIPSAGDSGNQGLHQNVGANATNVFLLVRSTNNLQILRYDTQAYATPTAGSWRFKCYASL